MDITKPKNDGSDRMDWENKITMKLNSRDIAQIVLGARSQEGKVDIFHKVERADGPSPTTSLKVTPGQTPGTWQWSIFKSVGENKKSATIYLDNHDMWLTFQILESAVPIIHGWVE